MYCWSISPTSMVAITRLVPATTVTVFFEIPVTIRAMRTKRTGTAVDR